jgi:NAD+ diphosphatase
MAFPDSVNLPFNGEIIRSRFTQKKPGELVSDEPGNWALLQGDGLVLVEGALYAGDLPSELSADREGLVFGEWDGKPVRVLVLSRELALPPGFSAVPWMELPDDLATLYGLARQIIYWQKMSANCSRCGGAMSSIDHTWGKCSCPQEVQRFPQVWSMPDMAPPHREQLALIFCQ